MANKAITEFDIGTPSSSATVLGEDGGTVKRFNVSDLGGSGGGIIYASELPSTPEQAIYVVTQDEVVKADFLVGVSNASEVGVGTVEIVDALPDDAQVCTDTSGSFVYVYYHTTEKAYKCYVDETLASALSMTAGWYGAETVIPTLGYTYGGIISSVDEATSSSSIMYFLEYTEAKTRVYVPLQDGTFLELTSGIRTRFDENSGTVSITEM